MMCATCTFDDFKKIIFGRGKQSYQGYSVEIDKDSVRVYRYLSASTLTERYRHGLDIAHYLTLMIDYGEASQASLVLISNDQTFQTPIQWWAGGAPYMTNESDGTVTATLTFTARDAQQPVWFFADSYFNWQNGSRWPYYLMQQGYTKWMADHLPGENSKTGVLCFDNDLHLGKPQYAVWCLGMNDATDDDTPDKVWLDAIQHFVSTCEEQGITPILSTTPNVPTKNHRMKNEWVRQSGYQYIDFATAVGSDNDDNWIEGMLSADGVHPTAKGAKALASQVLKDFPQLELSKLSN